MIFYFSGTGNSRWVAESLGKRLEDAVEDITDVKIEKKEYTYIFRSIPVHFPVAYKA